MRECWIILILRKTEVLYSGKMTIKRTITKRERKYLEKVFDEEPLLYFIIKGMIETEVL